jgi:hypothetical protein
LTRFVLGKIARRFDEVATSVVFIVRNAIPSLAFVPSDHEGTPGDVHVAFKANDAATSLGHMTHASAQTCIGSSIESILAVCQNASERANHPIVVDVHSRKIEALLNADGKNGIIASGGTFNNHPSFSAHAHPETVSLFTTLASYANLFRNLTLVSKVSSHVNFDVVAKKLQE